jgi:chorismate mutase/prephenate dehydratase
VDLRVPARTSLLLVTDHREGALVHCLQALAAYGINMTKLESRPLKEAPWRYSFYLDLEGNLGDDQTIRALDRMRERSRVLRVLGCYPKAQDLYPMTPPGAPAVLTENGPPPSEAPLPAAATGSQPGNGTAKKHSATPANLHTRIRRGKETVVEVGGVPIGGSGGFVVMAGPCAVESREQIRASAALVKRQGCAILRGGAYKPRTSPYSFQGLGVEGVSLLVEAGRLYGLPVVSEVLAPEQVEEMASQVDLLQVGARNMQNYPLLRELGRCHKPVLLKRGMSATIEELLHAAEYILSGGNQQVILCERGIRTFEKAMRSTLDLGAVVVLKERTHLPVIVDPSHAAGKRAWVPPLARAARAVGCDGIIVEVHPEPEKAKSDKDQALTPEQFSEMMTDLA